MAEPLLLRPRARGKARAVPYCLGCKYDKRETGEALKRWRRLVRRVEKRQWKRDING